MMLVVDEQKLVTVLGIRQTYPAWIPRLAAVGDTANGTSCGQLLVRKLEQRRKLLRRQTNYSKAHCGSSSSLIEVDLEFCEMVRTPLLAFKSPDLTSRRFDREPVEACFGNGGNMKQNPLGSKELYVAENKKCFLEK